MASHTINNFFSRRIHIFLRPNSFLRHLLFLSSGTLLAQAIPVLVSPILTRLYVPDDFAMFAVFIALTGTFTPIICGKYEVAMVLPKNRVYGEHLFGIAVYFSLAISITLFIVFLFAGDSVLSLLNSQQLGHWLYVIPLVMFLSGLFITGSYFSNRNKKYKLLARSKISRSLAASTSTILMGIAGAGFVGLLTGLFVGLFVASFFLLYGNRQALSKRIMRWGSQKKFLLYKFRHYPLYNATSALLNGLTLSLPVLFLSHYFSDDIVGYYALVIRATSVPIAFISESVSQIHLKKVVDLINNQNPVRPYLFKVTLFLCLVVLIPSIVIIFWGPVLFQIVFGAKWSEAGRYAQILMPGFSVSFVSATLSTTFGATNNNQLGAFIKIVIFISTLTVLLFCSQKQNIVHLLHALMINNVLCYLFLYILIFLAIKNIRELKR